MPWRPSGSTSCAQRVYSGFSACTTTLAPAACAASVAPSCKGVARWRAPGGSGCTGARRALASTCQPAAAKALTAAWPRRPLAPSTSTLRVGVFILETCSVVSMGCSVGIAKASGNC